MCKICEQVKKMTGKDVTEEEAHALIQEKADAMDAMKPELIKRVIQFVNATREEFGEDTFPPLMSAMALIIGSTLGKIPDDHIRAEALVEIFGNINEGVNMTLSMSQKDVPDHEKKLCAFSVKIALGTPPELEEHLRQIMRAEQESAKAVQESTFTVKPPVLH